MPTQDTTRTDPTAGEPTGGRACPMPVGLAFSRGSFRPQKPQRTAASTGVVTADVLDRTFS